MNILTYVCMCVVTAAVVTAVVALVAREQVVQRAQYRAWLARQLAPPPRPRPRPRPAPAPAPSLAAAAPAAEPVLVGRVLDSRPVRVEVVSVYELPAGGAR